jgi:hypothetical protein
MGYMHIDNLYKYKDILLFKECFAMEKIHGTSAHISWANNEVKFFSGGEKHENFVKLFDEQLLRENFLTVTGDAFNGKITIYGEAYGGKQQGMKDTYGPDLKFVAFDVYKQRGADEKDGYFLPVLRAEQFCKSFGIEFVDFERVPADVETLDKCRDADSTQAIRNGIGAGKKREGIVVRPLTEAIIGGKRVIAKHKRDDFRETKTPRTMDGAQEMEYKNAEAVADEWVVPMRLQHVLDKIDGEKTMERIPIVVSMMVEDVLREGSGEVEDTRINRKAISKKTVEIYKDFVKRSGV